MDNSTGGITTMRQELTEDELKYLARDLTMYKIGDGIQKMYFPILVPVSIVGNSLSFMVMVQPHNRTMSISIYIAALAISDTATLIMNFMSYLNIVHDIHLPPADISHCIRLIFSFASPLCSTLFILSMTFDRCYSILRPHKAASFNTVKRAKITIVTITVLSLLYNIPQYFLSKSTGANCVPYAKGGQYVYGQLYYWLSFLINFGGPFLLLLIMNCFIINTLRKRFSSIKKQNTANEMTQGQPQGQNQSQGQIQSSTVRTSEIQIYAILLLVTFSFLILTIPGTVILLYMIRVDVGNSPQAYAEFYLLQNVGEKMYYTNGGINFFLYVISGHKFRKDLFALFKCKNVKGRDISTTLDTNTATVNIEEK